MATQQEVIKKFMASLDTTSKSGTTAVDEAIKACSNFTSTQAVINQMLADCESYNAADSENGWKNFLLDKCGINLDNSDTGAITGLDAGGSSTKTAESVIPESGALKECTENYFSTNGVIFTLEKDLDELNEDEKFIWDALYTWWARESLTLIKNSYGYSFSDSDATTRNITVKFESDSSTSWIAWSSWHDDEPDGKVDSLSLTVNMNNFSNIDKDNVNGKAGEEFYLDRTLAHEFVHQLMYAKVDYERKLPLFIGEGLGELVHGIDDERPEGIQKLASNESLLKQALSMSTSSVKVSGVKSPSYVGGYMFFRYLAKQAADSTPNIINNNKSDIYVGGTKGDDSIKSSGNNVTISSGTGNDSIYAFGSKISINGSSGDNYIYLYSDASTATAMTDGGKNSIHSAAQGATLNSGTGDDYVLLYINATKNTVNASAGKDTVYSGAQTASINTGTGNDYIHLYSQASMHTVNAGTGDDTIKSYAQSDVLYQYKSGDGNDSIDGFNSTSTLSISGGNYSSTTSGEDIIVTVGDGKITLVGAASLSNVNIVGNSGKGINNFSNSVTLTGSAYADTIYNSGSKVKIRALGGNDSIDNRGSNVSINAGAGKDTIYNAGTKVTLVGYKSNDSILNSKSASEVFVDLGAGNDSIVNNSGGAGKITVSGGAGSDSIRNFAGSSSIHGGADNDTIYNGTGGNNVKIIGYTGKDSIRNYGSNVTISGGSGSDYILNESDASNVSISGGSGNDSIHNYGSKVTIDGGDGNDKIRNYASSTVTIKGGNGADHISNWGAAASIVGGSGNDSLYGDAGADTLSGGANNDRLYGYEGNDKITGGSGNDKLYGGDGNDSLTGGTGNDSLWGNAGADTFIYAKGDGKDIIYGFENNDLLKITGTFSATYSKSKDEVYFKVSTTSKAITLKDFTATSFHVNSSTYRISGSKLVRS